MGGLGSRCGSRVNSDGRQIRASDAVQKVDAAQGSAAEHCAVVIESCAMAGRSNYVAIHLYLRCNSPLVVL